MGEGQRTVAGQVTLRAHDVDQLNRAVSGAQLELMQLRPGVLDATVIQRSSGGVSVDQGSVNLPLRVRGMLDRRRYGIGLFKPGSEATHNGHHLDSSRVLYFMPGRELDGHFREPHNWTSLNVPEDWIDRFACTARHQCSLQLRTDCHVLRPDRGRLTALHLAAAAMATNQPDGNDSSIEDDWRLNHLRNALGETLSALDDSPGKETTHTLSHFRTARKAERYMRERLSEPFCIGDLCVALKVSRRYLEYAFNDVLGTSPSRYLRLLRLHAVRRYLKEPNAHTTVTREALRLGFNHLSLFAVQYKKAFGESPSSTLSSAQSAAGLVDRADPRGPPRGNWSAAAPPAMKIAAPSITTARKMR